MLKLALEPIPWELLGLFTIFPKEFFICFICTESLKFNAFNDSIILAELELNECLKVCDLEVPGRDSPDPDPDPEVGFTLSSLLIPSSRFASVTGCKLEDEILPLLNESNPLILRPPSFGLTFATERAQADDFRERVESVLDALELFLGLSPVPSPAVWVTPNL